jgi:hypothetical protein
MRRIAVSPDDSFRVLCPLPIYLGPIHDPFPLLPIQRRRTRRRVSIRWRAVEVEVPDHIVAVAPVELLVCLN